MASFYRYQDRQKHFVYNFQEKNKELTQTTDKIIYTYVRKNL